MNMNFSVQELLEQELKLKYFLYAYGIYVGLKFSKFLISKVAKKVGIFFQKKRVQRFIENRNNVLESFKIPTPQLSEETINKVLNSDITELKRMLQSKTVTSEDLVNIFSKRAQEYGVAYGIITHLKYDEAIEQAKKCDQLRKQNSPQCQLPLFGIPISIKETFDEKGYPSTIGSIFRLNHIPKEDGFSVKVLKDGGAIPFLRTNVPQAAMIFESMNDVYGRVLNPWDKTKYSGGSSGGEGAAIAARISPGGMGSDIGGSIRIPAAMCGVYGFKPTAQRSLMSGHTYYSDAFMGQRTVLCASGPLGKSVDDLILFFKQLSDPEVLKRYRIEEKDVFFPHQQINEAELTNNKKSRRFGYFKTTEAMDSTICAQRAVEIAVQKLRDEGHQVVEIELPNTIEIHDNFLQFLFSDSYEAIYDVLNKEDTVKEYLTFDLISSMNTKVKGFIKFLLSVLGQKVLVRMLKKTNPLSVVELNRFHYEMNKIQQKYLRLFSDYEIEAIICPAFGAPALAHSSSIDVASVAFFTFLWNVLNFPCGVLPVTKVLKEEQHFQNARDREITSISVDKFMKQNTEGLPVGVQVVTPPFKEEVCLNVMRILDEKIQFYKHNAFPELNK